MRRGKREKVKKSKRRGSEWTREKKEGKGYPGPTRGLVTRSEVNRMV